MLSFFFKSFSDSVFVSLLASLNLVSASSCGPSIFALPLKDYQVLPDVEDSFMRGISLEVGTPPQNLVVLPWADLNNVWLYDYLPFCDASIIFSDTICRERRGNFFYENTSSTYHKESSIAAAGGAETELNSTGTENGVPSLILTSLVGVDTLNLDENALMNFPIGIPRSNWDHGYTILHAMGMGRNSTILKRLFETGRIASRVWSIYWGRLWVEDEIDGAVVFGGYDEAKVIGQNYTQTLDYSEETGCFTGMKVTIKDIELIERTGDTTSIFPDKTGLDVCIVPHRQLLLEAPAAIKERFENVTGTKNIGPSYGLHWSALLYEAQSAYSGNMKITLTSGLEVVIFNDQYMVPFVSVERNGSRIFNNSQREFLMHPTIDELPTLGRYFLTSAYLMVDHEANTFTLWQANPTAISELVTSSGEESDVNVTCTTTTPASQPSATEKPDSVGGEQSTTQNSATSAIPGGALAGIVVAGVFGAFLCIILCVYVRRAQMRRRQDELHGAAGDIVPEGYEKDSKDLARQTRIYEMHEDSRPHEVTGSGHTVYEIDGRMIKR